MISAIYLRVGRLQRFSAWVCCCWWYRSCTSALNALLLKMKLNRLNKLYILAAALLLCLQSTAQKGFLYKAALDTVPQQGFYQIVVRPALAARLQSGLQDI